MAGMKTLLLGTVGLGLLMPQSTWAQGTPTPGPSGQVAQEPPSPADAGEIIVTATRREQTIQDAPVAVSAVGEAQIENAGIRDIRDLGQLTPSLQVPVSESSASVTARIRGVGTQGSNPGLESAVGVFIDGVYRSRNGVAFSDLGEVERIEVLRGPQGTLFGRNTSAGLINVTTKGPDFEPGGEAEFTYGNYDAIGGSASITGPIVADRLAFRGYGAYRQRDGWFRVNPGTADARRANDLDYLLLRGQLLWQPTADIDVRLIADYAERDEECCLSVTLRPGLNVRRDATGTVIASIANADILDASRGAGGPTKARDDTLEERSGFTNRLFDQQVREYGFSGEINWDVGPGRLTSITAYRDWRFINGQDFDFSRADLLYRLSDGSNGQLFRTFTQEVRFAGQTGILDYLVGGFYSNERIERRDRVLIGSDYNAYLSRVASFGATGAQNPNFIQGVLTPLGLAGAPFVAGSETRDVFVQNAESFAAFTHNVVSLTERLNLTLGLRYTVERKRFRAQYATEGAAGCSLLETRFGFNPAATAPAPLRALAGTVCLPWQRNALDGLDHRQRRTEKEFSGVATLAYEITDDINSYATYSRGYKAGGFNLDRVFSDANGSIVGANNTVRAPDTSFPAETVDAYELGLKIRALDGAVQANFALFRQDFKNFQLNTFSGVSFIVNAVPTVRSEGFELDLTVRPAEGLSLTGGLAYADARYGRNLGDFTTRNPGLFLLPGGRLTSSPEWTVSGSATYERPIAGDMTGLVSADVRWIDDQITGTNLDPAKTQGAYALVNARVGLRGIAGRFSVEAFVRNLFDQEYQQIAFDSPLQGSAPSAALPVGTSTIDAFSGEPRTYGLTLRADF